MIADSSVDPIPQERATPAGSISSAPKTFTALDLMLLLSRSTRLLIVSAVAALLVAVLVILIWPKTYTASTTILVPQPESSFAAASMLSQLMPASSIARDLGMKTPGETMVTLLKSRTVADDIINTYDLRAVYHKELMSEARKTLAHNLEVTSDKDGVIILDVTDRDPQRSAHMAQSYVSELYKLNQSLAISSASQRRKFYEAEVVSAKDALATAESLFQQTQSKTGLIQIDAQGRALIDSIANVRAAIATKNVELRALQTAATDQNPRVQVLQRELDGLRTEFAKLTQSSDTSPGAVLPAARNLPELGSEYVRALREMKYREAVYEMLLKQYEAARLDEARSPSLIQVIDPATVPDKSNVPRKIYVIIGCLLLGLFCAGTYVVLAEALRRNPHLVCHGRTLIVETRRGLKFHE